LVSNSGDLGASTGFRKAYLASIVCVASLTLVGQSVMGVYASRRSHEEVVSQRIENLEQDCEAIVRSAALLGDSKEPTVRARLSERLNLLFQRGSSDVSLVQEGAGNIDPATSTGQSLIELRDDFTSLSDQAHLILLQSPAASAPTLFRREESILGDLDGLTAVFHGRSESELPIWRLINIAIGLLTLGVLVGEYVWILRPKLRALKLTATELRRLNDRLVEQDRRLQDHQAELESQNAELVLVNGNLAELKEVHADAARRMQDLFDGLPNAVFEFDRNGIIREWNRAAVILFGIEVSDAVGSAMSEVLAAKIEPETIATWQKTPFEDRPIAEMFWGLDTETGVRYISSSVFPVHGHDQRISGGICLSVDVTSRVEYEAELEDSMMRINEYSIELEMQKTAMEEANSKLEALATTDGLTGLKNHRYFQERLEEEIERNKGAHETLSLFLMDVDHFKKFNDEFGHPAGDSVLRTIAEILHRHGSAHFIPARYGGEEFVGMMPGLTEAAAAALADQVRREIEAAYPGGHMVTASFGVAAWQPGLRGKGELIARADKALYASKKAGRNRVTVASWLWAEDSRPAA